MRATLPSEEGPLEGGEYKLSIFVDGHAEPDDSRYSKCWSGFWSLTASSDVVSTTYYEALKKSFFISALKYPYLKSENENNTYLME